MHSVLNENPNEVNRIEELFLDQPKYLAVLSLILMSYRKPQYAKGIYIRNKLEISDFHSKSKG